MRTTILAAAVAGGALLAGGAFVALRHPADAKRAIPAEVISKRDLNLVSVDPRLGKLNDGAARMTHAAAPKRRPSRRARINPVSNVVQLTPQVTQVQPSPEPEPERATLAQAEPEQQHAAGPSAQPEEAVYTPGSVGRAKGRWTGREVPAQADAGIARGVRGGGGECHGKSRGGAGGNHSGSGARSEAYWAQ